MNTSINIFFASVAIGALLLTESAIAQGTAFTYQGRLDCKGTLVSGNYDMTFALYDASANGNLIAGPVTNVAVSVSNGLFTVAVDFGDVFAGGSNWLQIAVGTNGMNSFVLLSPRQQVRPTPYALYAANAATVAGSDWSAWFGTNDPLAGKLPGSRIASGSINSNQIAIGGIAASELPADVAYLDTSEKFSGDLAFSGKVTFAPDPFNVYAGPHLMMFANQNGLGNTAFGLDALSSNSTNASANTAVGCNALGAVTTNSENTAVGFSALASLTNGRGNTVVGSSAMAFANGGVNNSAFGENALVWGNNSDNTAMGSFALSSLITGDQNTAVGRSALVFGTNEADNTAVGFESMPKSANASANAALGDHSLWNLVNGSNNVAMGSLSGFNLVSGHDNIYLGNQGTATDSCVISIGTQGIQNAASIAGIYGATIPAGAPVYVSAAGQLGTVTSSIRFKDDIHDMGEASDILLALRPVTFKYRPEIDTNNTPQYGLVAEDVDKIAPMLVIHDLSGKPYSVRYESVNAMLLNEFLKLHKTVEEQGVELKELRKLLEQASRDNHSGNPTTLR